MTKYKCKCGKTKELSVATIVHVDGEWETKESLSKKGDKLWAGAKEKLVGDRGINEDY